MRSPAASIAILGFGRSGTTWMSDIVSKCSGEVILFEPFHPLVYDKSSSLCYHTEPTGAEFAVAQHVQDATAKKKADKWMLRNHINSPTDKLSLEFIKEVWDNISIIGFKSVRLNHAVKWISDHVAQHVIFIIRHPMAVLASLQNRPRFWEEFGWEFHWKIFLERTIHANYFESYLTSELQKISNSLQSKIDRMTFMWAVTHMISLDQLRQIEVEPLYYEEFYLDPFNQSKLLMKKLNVSHHPIHPSYLFTPSMTALRTLHGSSSFENKSEFPQFFWKSVFSHDQVKSIRYLLEKLATLDDNLDRLLIERYSSSTFGL